MGLPVLWHLPPMNKNKPKKKQKGNQGLYQLHYDKVTSRKRSKSTVGNKLASAPRKPWTLKPAGLPLLKTPDNNVLFWKEKKKELKRLITVG